MQKKKKSWAFSGDVYKRQDEIQLTMSGITDEVTTVELCVINKLRKRIVSLVAMECTERCV